MLSPLDLNNAFFRLIAEKISNCEIYKKGISRFYIVKKNRNSNLLQACETFETEYSKAAKAGLFVNDLQVVSVDDVNITVRKTDQTEYQTVNLATNSYNDLDLENEPRRELADYVMTEALSSCLSRKIAGQLPIHHKLEEEIQNFLGYEKCILATCGYIAQQAVMFGLFHKGDVIFSDQHNHSSLVDGMKLTNAKVIVYPHLDYEALEELIVKHRHKYNCAGIVSDGVFSAHGTLADLDQIHELKSKYNLLSVIDDTHGFATIGHQKRGILDYFKSKPDVLTASLAKGLAGFGGAIVGNQAVVRVIDCLGRQNINTSHLTPLAAAQSYFNLQFLRRNLVSVSNELDAKIVHFNKALDSLGIKQYQNHNHFVHPIFSYYGKTEAEVVAVFQKMLEIGITAAFFPPPVSPVPTIRFSLHRKVDYETLTKLAYFLKANNLKPLSKQYWSKVSHIRPYQKPESPLAPNFSLLNEVFEGSPS